MMAVDGVSLFTICFFSSSIVPAGLSPLASSLLLSLSLSSLRLSLSSAACSPTRLRLHFRLSSLLGCSGNATGL
jgi:hypothetical protein